MIVNLARDIPAFVMYCVNGASGSSLLIESTESMIIIVKHAHGILVPWAGVNLGGGGGAGGGTRPPLIKSRPPLEIASLQSASHVHRASPPLFFINTHLAPPWINF